MSTSIEWTDETWNPIVGCSRVGPGCDHCYAVGVVHRGLTPHHRGLTIRRPGEPTDWTGEVREVPHMLDRPLGWKKPRRVFVNSLSDLFHPNVSDEYIARVFAVMALTPRHTYQVLTKRPKRMASLLDDRSFAASVGSEILATSPSREATDAAWRWPLPNVWLGVSIETNRYVWRADHLRNTPAAVRFISAEPLLGPLPSLDLAGIDWLIAGGESGPGARPMHPEWVRELRDRCDGGDDFSVCPGCGERFAAFDPDERVCDYCEGRGAEDPTAFLFKQWGDHDEHGRKVGKKGAGRRLDGRTWDEFPAAQCEEGR